MKPRTLAVALVLLAACRTGENYPESDGPRHASSSDAPLRAGAEADTLRIVSFNIAFAVRVDSALALLAAHPSLRDADVLLLQEMDEPGTRRIGRALGMRWVYYPAIRSLRTGRDFGNAVLSRWPIVDDDKIVLPHRARATGTQRTATAATLLVGDVTVRVYSTHLGAAFEVGDAARRDQLDAILDDAQRYERVVIGGDMNDEDVGRVALRRGYDWPTREGPRTTSVARWDHVFVRGLPPAAAESAGTVLDARGASDHRPVWVVRLFE